VRDTPLVFPQAAVAGSLPRRGWKGCFSVVAGNSSGISV